MFPQAQADRMLPDRDNEITAPLVDAYIVGVESGADHEMLFGLVDVAFAPDGELYVLEERNHRVLVYGPDGEFRRAFGREGQGPGEFQLPMTLAVTLAGEVAVWDFQLKAYLVFDRQGEYVRNVGWGDFLTGPRRNTLRAWSDGGVAYLPGLLHDDGDPESEINRGTIMIDRLGDSGAPTELHVVFNPKRRGQQVDGAFSLTNGPLFAPTARWDALPGGKLAVADGVGYEVRVVTPSTGAEFRFARDIAPRAVTEADRDNEREKRRYALENAAGASFSGGGGGGGGGSSSNRVRNMVAAMEFEKLIPVIRDLRVDGAGRIWVQRQGATVDDPGPIDIVTATGEYVGTLPPMPMPDDFGPDGLVAWMEQGREVELERVIVRRLPADLR